MIETRTKKGPFPKMPTKATGKGQIQNNRKKSGYQHVYYSLAAPKRQGIDYIIAAINKLETMVFDWQSRKQAHDKAISVILALLLLAWVVVW